MVFFLYKKSPEAQNRQWREEKRIAQLDTKTVYTFMESLVTIKDYVQVAKSMGYDALGIMDAR